MRAGRRVDGRRGLAQKEGRTVLQMTVIRLFSRLEVFKRPIARRLLDSRMKMAVVATVSNFLRRPKTQQPVSRSEAAAEVTAKQHVHTTSTAEESLWGLQKIRGSWGGLAPVSRRGPRATTIFGRREAIKGRRKRAP